MQQPRHEMASSIYKTTNKYCALRVSGYARNPFLPKSDEKVNVGCLSLKITGIGHSAIDLINTPRNSGASIMSFF
jgi:hypothetical protein